MDLVNSSYSIRSLLMVHRIIAQIRAKGPGGHNSRTNLHIGSSGTSSSSLLAANSLEHSMWAKPSDSSVAIHARNSTITAGLTGKSEHMSTVVFKRRLSQIRKTESIVEEHLDSNQEEGLLNKTSVDNADNDIDVAPYKLSETISQKMTPLISQNQSEELLLSLSLSKTQSLSASPSIELSPSKSQSLSQSQSSTIAFSPSLILNQSNSHTQSQSLALSPSQQASVQTLPFSNSQTQHFPLQQSSSDISDYEQSGSSLAQPYQGRLTNLFTFEKTRVESFAEDEGCPDSPHPIGGAFDTHSSDSSGDDDAHDDNCSVKIRNNDTTKEPTMLTVSGSQRFSKSRGLGSSSLVHMESGANYYGHSGDRVDEVTPGTLTTIMSHDSTKELFENVADAEGLRVFGTHFFTRPLQIKLKSVTALRNGLEDARSRHQHKNAVAVMSRSHVLLRQAHHQRARRKATHKRRTALTTASFLFFDFILNPQNQAVMIWVLWLLSGTLFYMFKDGLSISLSFYESVNTGYGIFLSRPFMDTTGHIFMLLHLLTGTLIVAGCLTMLATYLNYKKHERQIAALSVKRTGGGSQKTAGGGLDATVDGSPIHRARMWVLDNTVHLCLVALVLVSAILCSKAMNWSFLDALYFTVSMLSTGGQRSMPEESSDWHYLAVACFACVGVPLMAVSLGLLTHRLSRLGEDGQQVDSISAPVTQTELDLLRSTGMESVPGQLEISEFAVLMMLRMDALHPNFIKLARYRFEHLKEPGATSLSIHSVGSRRDSTYDNT